jgi:hypothetical protein
LTEKAIIKNMAIGQIKKLLDYHKKQQKLSVSPKQGISKTVFIQLDLKKKPATKPKAMIAKKHCKTDNNSFGCN